MARLLKQSTAFTFRIGPFVDSTDGFTAETALSIAQADIQISKAGGAFAQTSASPTTTHDADGWYQCPLTTTDTGTLGSLTVQIVMSGALPVWEHFMVVPANVYDSLISGSDNLQVDTVQVTGTAQTAKDIGAAVPAAAAGASGGLLISGSNSGTTTLGALTVTGAMTAAITGNITGNLSGSVGSVTASVNVGQIAGQTANAASAVTFPATVASTTNITAGTLTTVTNLTNAATAGDFTATQKASINAEVLDVLNTDTFAEPGQGAPAATTTLAAKINYLYKAWRNRVTQTSSTYSLYADDATTVDQKATVADDGTTFSRTEIAAGP
jgi:hypothetical protein